MEVYFYLVRYSKESGKELHRQRLPFTLEEVQALFNLEPDVPVGCLEVKPAHWLILKNWATPKPDFDYFVEDCSE